MSNSTRIVVVGGGIVAASAAYHLSRRGVSVIVVEGEEAGPATDAGAGIICPWTDADDGPAYRLGADGARYYPELIAMLADDGETETGYTRVGALCVRDDRTGQAARGGVSLREIEALVRSRIPEYPEIGEIAVLGAGQPRELFPPLAAELGAVWISGAARIDGRAIRDSLLRAATRHGVRRMTGTAMLTEAGGRVAGVVVRERSGGTGDGRVGGEGGRGSGSRAGGAVDRGGSGSGRTCGGGAGHSRSGGAAVTIEADTVVVAAGAWTGQLCAGLAAWPGPSPAIGPQRGQIVHLDIPGADTSAWPVVLPARDPYLLAFPPSRVVAGATREDAGFDYRVTASGLAGVLGAAIDIAPGLADATVAGTRVGFRPVTPDGLPLLGRLADGLVVAAGNGPEGLTAGPWTGRAAAALALTEEPPVDLAAFDPARPMRRRVADQ